MLFCANHRYFFILIFHSKKLRKEFQKKFEWNFNTTKGRLKYTEKKQGRFGRLLGICRGGESKPFVYGRLNKQFVLVLSALGIPNTTLLETGVGNWPIDFLVSSAQVPFFKSPGQLSFWPGQLVIFWSVGQFLVSFWSVFSSKRKLTNWPKADQKLTSWLIKNWPADQKLTKNWPTDQNLTNRPKIDQLTSWTDHEILWSGQ